MNKAVKTILESVRYATISTTDKEGQPWAAPIWYAYDDQCIYWWSPKKSQHSLNIRNNNNVYITVFDSTAAEGEGLGVYIRAVVEEVPDSARKEVEEIFNKTTKVFKINENSSSGEAPTRFYRAEIKNTYMNSRGKVNGYFVDNRVEM